MAALRYGNWKISFLKQPAHGLHVWIQPFEELRAPILTNLRMDPFELAQDIGMDYGRWFVEHMFMFAPAGGRSSAGGCRASASSRRGRSRAASTSIA